MVRQTLTSKEKVDIIPVDIVHEATYDENIPVPWAFTDQIHLAYKSYVGHLKREKSALIVEFLNNVKTKHLWKKHLSICAAREGITYAFDNAR